MAAFCAQGFTTAARIRAFQQAMPAHAAFLLDNITNDFWRSLWTQMSRFGRLSEKQVAAIDKAMGCSPAALSSGNLPAQTKPHGMEPS